MLIFLSIVYFKKEHFITLYTPQGDTKKSGVLDK